MSALIGRHRLEPALAESIRSGEGDDELSIIARLADADRLPPGIRVVTRFGDIATLRIDRNRVAELVDSEAVLDMEAVRRFRPVDDTAVSRTAAGGESSDDHADSLYSRRPVGLTTTGRGCVVGVLDWGMDFVFPSFCKDDGSTRLEAIWDQRGEQYGEADNRWGYGRIFKADEINRALAAENPYQALGYDPSDSDTRSRKTGMWQGTHGTHVMHIAAGNARGGGMPGVAPEADLVFVHLSHTARVLGTENLGDSASILEAIDFIFSIAGDRPCSINASIGAHGGPHDGLTLLEQGIDRSVWLHNGRALINSAGNYYGSQAHAQGKLQASDEGVLQFEVPTDDPTNSELEVYYESTDRFRATVLGPDDTLLGTTEPGEESPLLLDGKRVGYMYHRSRQVGSGDRLIDLFLDAEAAAGLWQLKLEALEVEDGRFHAWIERDRGLSPKFTGDDVDTSSTTGTICNGKYSITVGAYDPHREERRLGTFSSAGPTRDGRMKPEIVAPGVDIISARSTPPDELPGARYISKNGTSMAAPHVTGAVALMFEAAGYPMNIVDTRALLFASSDAVTLHDSTSPVSDVHRLGYGYLDILAAENAAGEWGRARLPMAQTESDGIDEESGDEPGEQPTEESVEVDESLLKAVSALLSANGQQQVMSFALSLLDEEVSEDARTSSTDTPPSLLGLYPGYIEAPYEQEE